MKSRNYAVLYLTLGLLFFLSGSISAQSNEVSRKAKQENVEKTNAKKKARKTVALKKTNGAIDGTEDAAKVETEKPARKSRTAATSTNPSQRKKMVKRKKFKGKTYKKGNAYGKDKGTSNGKDFGKKRAEDAKNKVNKKSKG